MIVNMAPECNLAKSTCIMPTRAAPPGPESRLPAPSIGLCQAYSAVIILVLEGVNERSESTVLDRAERACTREIS